MRITSKQIDRFWNKVAIRGFDDCWDWIAAKLPKPENYGQVYFGGKTMRAHRVSWIINRGEIPKGMHVLHKCDNPPCVNPNHLWIGTHGENMKDMVIKDRHRPQDGEDNPNSKLSNKEVQEIRELYKTTKYSHRGLAKIFKVSRSAIHHIFSKRIGTTNN